jgi:PAS domain S-box-containing protein
MSVAAYPGSAGDTELRRLRTLYDLLANLTRAQALDEVYEAAITSLLAATEADRAAILIFDSDGVMRFKAWRNLSPEYRQAATGHTPWPQGARNAQPLTVPDVLSDDSLAALRDVFARENIRALAFIPLALETGVFGKFMLYYAEPHDFSVDELGIAQAIASHVALVTDRKRAEAARAESEQRLQAILDNSATVIFLKDLTGCYLLVNHRFEELFHVAKSAVVGRTDYDVFPAETADRLRESDRRVLDHGGPLAIEENVPHDDGIHTYIAIKFPLKGPDGDVTGVCGIATDITERKQLETASLRLAAIVESSGDAIIGKDLNGVITSWNKGAELIFGYRADEAVGHHISMLAAPGRLNETPEILSHVREGERVEHYETRRRTKGGELIDLSLTVSPVRDLSGTIIGASSIARDISERKRAEQEHAILLSREQEARRTAELLNQVGPNLTAELDSEKLTQSVTDLATALVGAEFGAFFHNVVNEKGESYMLYTLSGVPREAFANFPMPRNTDVFGPTFRGEGVVRCDDITKDPRYGKNVPHHGMPDGHLPVRSYLAASVVARSGEVLGGLFFGHSVPGRFTESHEAIVNGIAAQAAIALDNARLFEQRQWAQAELKRPNEELRRVNHDLETFAYSASHDLQEPLRTIALSAQLLERRFGKDMDGDSRAFLEGIIGGASRMNALLQDLLAYTVATKSAEGIPPAVDSAVVLASVLENLKAPVEQAGAEVTFTKLPVVYIHESRLAQLFQNLISNALKYRAAEGPRIHISAEQRDGWTIFSIADNGIGIEQEYSDQIFGLFKRLHSRERYPGSGIGLAICQRIIEHYGGRIWLEKSIPGQGSTFCFAIPV